LNIDTSIRQLTAEGIGAKRALEVVFMTAEVMGAVLEKRSIIHGGLKLEHIIFNWKKVRIIRWELCCRVGKGS